MRDVVNEFMMKRLEKFINALRTFRSNKFRRNHQKFHIPKDIVFETSSPPPARFAKRSKCVSLKQDRKLRANNLLIHSEGETQWMSPSSGYHLLLRQQPENRKIRSHDLENKRVSCLCAPSGLKDNAMCVWNGVRGWCSTNMIDLMLCLKLD